MSYLDLYKKVLLNEGQNISDATINTMINQFNDSFHDQPNYKIIKLDGIDTEVLISKLNEVSYTERLNNLNKTDIVFIFRPNTNVSLGSIVEWNNYTWLIIDTNWDNLIPKAEAIICNKILDIVVGETKTLQGYDSMHRPVYNIIPVKYTVPCVARNLLSSTALGDAINVPNGSLHIQCKYVVNHPIKENQEFEMLGVKYKITAIGTNKVYNDVGILSILAQRIP